MSDTSSPALVLLIGPPAVGKMTVGFEIAKRSGLRLFHNHQTIDLALQFFQFGAPAFQRLVGELRQRVFDEVAQSTLPGLVFTYVWAFDEPEDEAIVQGYAAPFYRAGGRVLFVELEATQDERLRRNETPFRLSQKPFKRDIEASRARLLADDATHQLNSRGAFDGRADYLRVDTNHVAPDAVAEQVISHFGLPRSEQVAAT